MPTSIRARVEWVVISAAAVAVVYIVTPAGPHAWHWLHIVAQKLYYVPILLAAGWFGAAAALGTAFAISVLFAVHVVTQWAAVPMVQAEELAEIASYLLVAFVSGTLFARVRAALEQVRAAHEETLGALASSLELRERYTAGHSKRVRAYSLLLAEKMGITDDRFLESLGQGALLHDVGKIGIPDHVLLKAGPLTAQETQNMRRHPDLGAELVGRIAFLSAARDVVRAHHERFDGTGYPRALRGDSIPLAARVFAVADTFDALTTDRPYHAAAGFEDVACEIALQRGSQFDPRVVDAFLRIPFDAWERAASTTGIVLRREGHPAVEHAVPVGVIPT